MRRRPIIGIPTQTLHSIDGIPEALPESWVMNQRYSRTVAAAGGLPVMIPLLDDDDTLRALYDRMDAVLLPGGVDLDPATYGEPPLPSCGRLDPARDRVELRFARWAIAEGKPLFGLCRGLQIVNVALGGTLYQDTESQMPGAHVHQDIAVYDGKYHHVEILPGTRLAALYPGVRRAKVNSLHHQAVNRLADGLAVEARSAEDGVIEAIRLKGPQYVAGVQWHPEFLHGRDDGVLDAAPLLKEFLQASHENSQSR